MRQISPIARQRAKVGLIVFCALALIALMVLLITCRREVQLEQQPQQSQEPPQPQEPQEPQEPPQSPQRQQSPAVTAVTPQPQQSPEPQQSQEPQEPHARAVADVRAVATLLEDYKSRNGAYPTTGQGLEALGAARKDPWGGDYIYQSPSTRGRESYDLFSAGPDRQPDTPDDDWGEIEEPSE